MGTGYKKTLGDDANVLYFDCGDGFLHEFTNLNSFNCINRSSLLHIFYDSINFSLRMHNVFS